MFFLKASLLFKSLVYSLVVATENLFYEILLRFL